jgi:hypothetical protein
MGGLFRIVFVLVLICGLLTVIRGILLAVRRK